MVPEGADTRGVVGPGRGATRAARYGSGLAVWYLAGVEKSRPVKPTWDTWQRFGLSPDAGRRGLAALERAGLVAVDRHPGRCPVVTILESEKENSSMSASPSTNGSNGRGSGGRFAKGNAGGPGNPHARKVAQLRSTLLRAISSGDLRAVVKKLLDQAKAGDVQAAKLVIERCLGPAAG